MQLLKNGLPVGEDAWQPVEDGAPLPPEGAVVVSFNRWKSEREHLHGRNTPVGVRVKNDERVLDLIDDVGRLDLIALNFPKFNDGRAYSQARLLRERLGYKGELRATGAVFRDQLLFMQRCGFDAYEIGNADAIGAWQKALGEFDRFYQPVADGRPALLFRHRAAAQAAE